MKDETEKKSLFARLNAKKKVKGSSCCCNFEVEEIPEEEKEKDNTKKDSKDKSNSCC